MVFLFVNLDLGHLSSFSQLVALPSWHYLLPGPVGYPAMALTVPLDRLGVPLDRQAPHSPPSKRQTTIRAFEFWAPRVSLKKKEINPILS